MAFLQAIEEDDSICDTYFPFCARNLVAGKKEDQDHLLIASPSNTSGSLVKNGFHDRTISLLQDDLTKEHALVALNWDVTTNALSTTSKSAGEYEDMAVVVPSVYVSVVDQANPVPYFYLGGHSTATAMLSAVISSVRGYYPELKYKEVRTAILQGANKNIPGYKEELHGQGMLNLRGALGVAEKIISSPNRNQPLPIQ